MFKPNLNVEYLYKELNIEKGKKVIGIFSWIDWWKGHKLFLEAAKLVVNKLNELKKMNDVIFLIVGEGDKTYKKEIINYTKELNLTNYVIFTGFRKDVHQLMNLCDVIVNPSIEPEPFGRTIIEGMACGKPVIATNIGATKEIIKNMEDGILVNPQANELASAIILLLNNSYLYNKIAKNGIKKVKKLFSIERQINEIENLYMKIIRQ